MTGRQNPFDMTVAKSVTMPISSWNEMAWMMEHLKVDQQATFIRVIRSCYVELRKEQSLGENPDYSDWDKLRAALPEEEKVLLEKRRKDEEAKERPSE